MTKKFSLNSDAYLFAKNGLGPHDLVRVQDEKLLEHDYEVITVTFQANEHDRVVSVDVYQDNTFKIGGSTCTPTARFTAYAAGYSRALAFVAQLGLVPRL
jgi:hypothetical protein